jgi:hypothetical protein
MEIWGSRIVVPEGVLLREVGGEAVVLNLHTESYFGLDAIGTRMWAVMTQAPTLCLARDALLTEFEVSSEQLDADLTAFVLSLKEAGLVDVVPS